MAKLMVLCLGLLAAAISYVGAVTQEELAKIKSDLSVLVNDCAKKFNVAESDLQKAKENHNMDSIDPCFIGCVFKTVKLINDKGLYDPNEAIDSNRKYFSSDDAKDKFLEVVKDCAKVNDEPVSDGEEGCERSKLLLACYRKHKHELMPSF